jgi:hypothetical protein
MSSSIATTNRTNCCRKNDALYSVPPRQLIIIDSNVEQWEILAAGVGPDCEVHILDPNRDGITQITEILEERKEKREERRENFHSSPLSSFLSPLSSFPHPTPLTALHIISHGSPGSIHLGNSTLNPENLEAYHNQLQQWQTALSEDADINIYGCNVAQGVTGQAFIQQLAHLTQADIAASNDLTG